VPKDQITEVIGIRAGDRYVRAKLRKAQAAIVRLFRQKRYYEVQVSNSWELGEGRRGVLHFTIEPGPLFVVQFSGNHALSDDKLLGVIDLPGRPIVTDGTWREIARRAQRAYQGDGYYRARVDVHIESGPPRLIRFTVSEGRVFHIGAVRFEGRRGVPEGILRAQ